MTNNRQSYFLNEVKDIVVWSGGVDSTILLHKLLQRSSVQEPIGALSIDHTFLGTGKRKAEEFYRQKYINEHVNENKLSLIHETMRFDSDHQFTGGNGMAQITAWVANAVQIAGDESTLYLGVLSGDDQVLRLHLVQRMVDNINIMTGKKVKVAYPLLEDLMMNKREAILRAANEDLLKYCWQCEFTHEKSENEFVPCVVHKPFNVCRSCQTHIFGLFDAMLIARAKSNKRCIDALTIELKRYGIEKFSVKEMEKVISHFMMLFK